jgi:dTDP-4-amino-4,6-dideoxygalactose transaminase
MDWRVPLADLDFGPEEENAVIGVLRSKWLTMGEVTQRFETEFGKMVGSRYVFAVSNATEALHLAYLAVGVGPGDEVIVPSLSFVATSNAVLYAGGDVRFADVCGSHDLTIDPEDIERKITPHTRAIAVMHYGGYPCRMEEIMAIAQCHHLPVIEDAAHSPGATLQEKALGTWGEVGCFSFFSNKNLSTGEGGMIVTDNEEMANKIRLQRSHGMTTLTYDRHKGHAYSYDVVDLGFNYRIDEIRAALGLEQLKKLAHNNALRKTWSELYRAKLANVNVEIPFQNHPGQSAYHLFPVLLPQGADRKQVIDRMRQQQIQTSIHYPPTHCFTYYTGRYGSTSLPRTEDLARRELTLPLYPTMGEEAVELVVQALKTALEKRG